MDWGGKRQERGTQERVYPGPTLGLKCFKLLTLTSVSGLGNIFTTGPSVV